MNENIPRPSTVFLSVSLPLLALFLLLVSSSPVCLFASLCRARMGLPCLASLPPHLLSHTCQSSAHLASTTCFSIKRETVILPIFVEESVSPSVSPALLCRSSLVGDLFKTCMVTACRTFVFPFALYFLLNQVLAKEPLSICQKDIKSCFLFVCFSLSPLSPCIVGPLSLLKSTLTASLQVCTDSKACGCRSSGHFFGHLKDVP